MGYPKIGSGCDSLLSRYVKLKPITVHKPKGNNKELNVLISEFNPKTCDLIKEMSRGGAKGSVPINFASTKTMARTCPPKFCNCKRCPCLTVEQERRKKLILYAKYLFLGGSIVFIWAIGGFGSTWDTWSLKECVKNLFFDIMGIKFVYKDKCNPPTKKDKPICCANWCSWNNFVVSAISYLTYGYDYLAHLLNLGLNYESCDYVIEKKKKDKPKPEKKKKKKKIVNPDKIYKALFNEFDPINIPCNDHPDYYAKYFEIICEENKKKEEVIDVMGTPYTVGPEATEKIDCCELPEEPKKKKK